MRTRAWKRPWASSAAASILVPPKSTPIRIILILIPDLFTPRAVRDGPIIRPPPAVGNDGLGEGLGLRTPETLNGPRPRHPLDRHRLRRLEPGGRGQRRHRPAHRPHRPGRRPGERRD